jgi:hypothetical protein
MANKTHVGAEKSLRRTTRGALADRQWPFRPKESRPQFRTWLAADPVCGLAENPRAFLSDMHNIERNI